MEGDMSLLCTYIVCQRKEKIAYHAVQFAKSGVVGRNWVKEWTEPRMEWGTEPRTPSRSAEAPSEEEEEEEETEAAAGASGPRGCCSTEAISSTAREAACKSKTDFFYFRQTL